jgi:hypothetical protein
MEILHEKKLYSISSEVWQAVYDDVDFSDDDEQPTSDQL